MSVAVRPDDVKRLIEQLLLRPEREPMAFELEGAHGISGQNSID
jgi:hypothetical protein